MNYNYIIEKLEQNASTFKSLLENITDEQARWKPSQKKWSLLEVTNHLYDEEREDFRKRIKDIFDDPQKSWSPVDPEKWISEREYSKRDMNESLKNFLSERKKSVEWLNSLVSPDWKAIHNHIKLGEMSAEKLLANWLAHDYLHMRQISFLNWIYLSQQAAGIELNYAGDW